MLLSKININKEALEKIHKVIEELGELSKELSKKAKEKFFEGTDGKNNKRRLVNILILDSENFLFDTLAPVISGWELSLRDINEALFRDNSVVKLETGYELLGKKLIDKYANQITDAIMQLIARTGKGLKLANNYGYISVVFVTAQERNKPFLEEVRKKLIKKLQELNKTTIVRFIYSANQKENDDYLFEGIIEQILYGNRVKLIPNAEKLPEGQKREYENFLKFTPVIVGITNDKRLKERLKRKYGSNLILLETQLNKKLQDKLRELNITKRDIEKNIGNQIYCFIA